MAGFKRKNSDKRRGLLARLARDRAGNVFAMTAAAVVPMIGVVGGAIDASRMYLTHSRLQAACDSGVLAGRKAMSTSTYDATAKGRATAMFNFNFQDADFQTTGTTFTTSATANGRVNGTASTSVPMSLMKIFGFGNQPVSVSCSADVQIPNIDIVFVLDVTGSMDDEIDGTRKIESMQAAAIRFYDTLQAQLTAAGANAGRVRYGFVPYSQAVNGSNLFVSNPAPFNSPGDQGQLPLTALVDTMRAESRVAWFDPTGSNAKYIQDVDISPISYNQVYDASRSDSIAPYVASTAGGTRMSNQDCGFYSANQSFAINDNTYREVTLFPRSSFPGDGVGDSVLYIPDSSSTAQTTKPTSGPGYWQITFSRVSKTWEDNSGNNKNKYSNCTRRVTRTRFVRQDYRFSHWTYQPVTYDVSSFKAGDPIQYASNITSNFVGATTDGPYTPVELAAMSDTGGLTLTSTTWNGCIEERSTTAAANFKPIPAAAKDLDSISGFTDDTLRWRPVLNRLTYNRGQTGSVDSTTTLGNPDHSCPAISMRNLNEMTRTAFVNYVNSLTPNGYTYLDVGMIWGLRMITPQGIFGARNLSGPNGGQISRHIIFLTDGEPVSVATTYSAYGLEVMSRRVTGSTGVAQATLHSRRFQALCDSQRGSVSIWAIAFGTSVTGNLSNCADPNRSYQADDADQLDAAFAAIARDIADLRLVQ